MLEKDNQELDKSKLGSFVTGTRVPYHNVHLNQSKNQEGKTVNDMDEIKVWPNIHIFQFI